MWSVVTESPSSAKTLACWTGWMLSASGDNPWKKGGSWMYVDSLSHSYNVPSGVSISFQRLLLLNTWAYSSRNISGVTALEIVSAISLDVGQISCKYTG